MRARDASARTRRFLPLIVAMLLGACATEEIATTPGREGPALDDEVLVAGDGALLPLHRWLPPERPKAIVVALHGMNDYGRAFAGLGTFFARRGIATYAYDQRGFGSAPGRNWWPGNEALVSDLATATELLRQRYPGTPLHCLGESMGGAVILVAVSRHQVHCDSVVLSAPAIWGEQTMPALERAALSVANGIAPDTVVYGTGLRIRASDNLAALRALRADPLVLKGARIDAIAGLASLMTEAFDAAAQLHGPALWLHGKNDQIIPPGPTRAALRRLPQDPSIKVARYPLGYHLLLRDLDASLVAHDIVSWIYAPDAPLPSGAERAETAHEGKSKSPQ